MTSPTFTNAKLKPADIQTIRDRARAGERRRVLADEYGVTEQAIYKILNGRTWKHVVDPLGPVVTKTRHYTARRPKRPRCPLCRSEIEADSKPDTGPFITCVGCEAVWPGQVAEQDRQKQEN